MITIKKRITAILMVFIICFSMFGSFVSADTVEIFNIKDDVWSAMSDEDKDRYFRYAIEQNNGIIHGSTLELDDFWKFTYYNNLVDFLLGNTDDLSIKISLELLGIVDFNLGFFNDIKDTSDSIAQEELLNTPLEGPLVSFTFKNGYSIRTRIRSIDNPDTIPNYNYCFCVYFNGKLIQDDLYFFGSYAYPAYDFHMKVVPYERKAVIYWSSYMYGYSKGIVPDNRGYNFFDVSQWYPFGTPNPIESAETIPEDDGSSGDGDDGSSGDGGSSDDVTNSDILDILQKIYNQSVTNGSKLDNLKSLLLSLNSQLSGLSKESTQQQVLAAILALQVSSDSGTGNGDFPDFDIIINLLRSNNELAENINATLTENIYKVLCDILTELQNAKDYTEILDSINQSIIEISQNLGENPQLSEVVALLGEIKDKIKESEQGSADYSEDISELSEKLSSLITKMDIVIGLLSLDTAIDIFDELTDEESKYIDALSDVALAVLNVLPSAVITSMLLDFQSVFFNSTAPADMYVEYNGEQIPFLTADIVAPFEPYLDFIKIFTSALMIYGWLLLMRRRISDVFGG